MKEEIKENILVVGGSGFLGSEILNKCVDNFNLISISRFKPIGKDIIWIPTGDLFTIKGKNKIINLKPDKIIYTTFIAHQKYKKSKSFQKEARNINYKLLKIVIDIALKINCQKFIYISTAGIYGNSSLSGKPITENSRISPESQYANMKLKCEKILIKKLSGSKVNYTILRPCLIYGKNIKGNLFLLKNLIDIGLPLPFKYENNKRSFLGLNNFVCLIQECLINSSANNEIFLVSDIEQTSLYSLVSMITSVRFKDNKFFNFPIFILFFLKRIFYLKKYYYHLYSDLVIDSSYVRYKLSWHQPRSQLIGFLESFFF